MHGHFSWKGNRLFVNGVEVARAVRQRPYFMSDVYWQRVIAGVLERDDRFTTALDAKRAVEQRFKIASL